MEELARLIRNVPDFPKPGIQFKDVTPLLQDPTGLKKAVQALADALKGRRIDKIVAVESRGFIFGAPLSVQLGVGFVPVRKQGKLPWTKIAEEYILEYGTDRLEMHADALKPGDHVAIIDDLLATGGTVGAVCNLVEKQGAKVEAMGFIVELDFLKGRDKLKGRDIISILHY